MALGAGDRDRVTRLAAVLRVADGLDRSHAGAARLEGLRRAADGSWELSVSGVTPLDLAGARDKADLWARVFGPLTLRAP
jgi:exopolyphosphatase/guanosine-5'-triphosphate,3'-diphosphate pyrophosphatase